TLADRPRPPEAAPKAVLPREDRHRGGEAVQERRSADRPDLAGGEEPCRRRAREGLLDDLGVMIGDAEQPAPAAVAREDERAGGPASSWMMWPSADVIVSSGPNGAAPWETHGSTSTPSSRTPTAPPLSMTSSSRNRAASPSLVRALATPPMIVTPGARSATA